MYFSLLSLLYILDVVGYVRAGSITYRVTTRISYSSSAKEIHLSKTSTLEDTCTCQLNDGNSFPCGDQEKIPVECGMNKLSLSCSPVQYPSAVAMPSHKINIPCATPGPVSVRCSLSSKANTATLKCTGGSGFAGAQTFCRLNNETEKEYLHPFTSNGQKFANLPCGGHVLRCRLHLNGSSNRINISPFKFNVRSTSGSQTSLSIGAQMTIGNNRASLILTSRNSIDCNCMYNNQSAEECRNGTVFEPLSLGQQMLKLNCCSTQDQCGNVVCVERKLSFTHCPSDAFNGSVVTSGSKITLSFRRYPRARYMCSLFRVSQTGSKTLIKSSSCSYGEFTHETLPPGKYYMRIKCYFPASPVCDRTFNITDIEIVKPAVAIDSLQGRRNGSSIFLEFTANCPAEFFLCRVDNSDEDVCSSPHEIKLQDLAAGSHTFTVIAICAGTASTPATLTFNYNVGNTADGDSCNANISLAITGTSVVVIYPDSVSSDTKVRCKVDDETFVEPCTNGTVLEVEEEGEHVFRAEIMCGNEESVNVSETFTIETDPCRGKAIESIVASRRGSNSLRINFDAHQDLRTTCSFNGGVASSCTSPFDVNITNLCSGTYRIIITGYCGGQSDRITVTGRVTVNLTSKPEPCNCPGAERGIKIINARSSRIDSNRKLFVRFTASSQCEENFICYGLISGRKPKLMMEEPTGSGHHQFTFKNAMQVQSLNISCEKDAVTLATYTLTI